MRLLKLVRRDYSSESDTRFADFEPKLGNTSVNCIFLWILSPYAYIPYKLGGIYVTPCYEGSFMKTICCVPGSMWVGQQSYFAFDVDMSQAMLLPVLKALAN